MQYSPCSVGSYFIRVNTFHYIEDTLSFLWSFMFLYGIPGRENKRDGLGTNWKKCIIAFYFFPVWGVCDDE